MRTAAALPRLPQIAFKRTSPTFWLFLASVVLAAVAFWQSFYRLAPFIGVETAVGLVPAVPLLTIWLVWSTARRRSALGQPVVGSREPALDFPVAAALLFIAAWLMWNTPATDGWYFWARRLDLLGLVFFNLGAAVFLWGLQSLLWYRTALFYSLLIWPDLLVRLQDSISMPLALFTSLVARPVVLGLGVPLEAMDDPTVFVSASEANWGIIIGDTCSGLNAVLSVLLVSIPAAVHFGVNLRAALPWLAKGMALAMLSNILRVVLLFLSAEYLGVGVALRTVHPVLGAILLAAVFAYLWTHAPKPAPLRPPTAPAGGKPVTFSRNKLLLLGAITLTFSVASYRITAFEPLPPIGPPSAPIEQPMSYVQLPTGWEFQGFSELAWQTMFGPESNSYAMSFASPSGAVVKAQLVATPDRDRLRAFTLENCRIYRGNDVVGTRTVDLGAGGKAFLLNVWDRSLQGPGRFSILYWESPAKVANRDFHMRFALFAVEADRDTFPPVATPGFAPGGPEFEAGDSLLVGLARDITDRLLRSARPS